MREAGGGGGGEGRDIPGPPPPPASLIRPGRLPSSGASGFLLVVP